MVNKWDMIPKETNTMVELERQVRDGLPFAPYIPMLFGSALT